jgi:hypothetical protein
MHSSVFLDPEGSRPLPVQAPGLLLLELILGQNAT